MRKRDFRLPEDPTRRWATSELYGTLDSRFADLDSLENELPSLARRESERMEAVWRRVIDALRAATARQYAESRAGADRGR